VVRRDPGRRLALERRHAGDRPLFRPRDAVAAPVLRRRFAEELGHRPLPFRMGADSRRRRAGDARAAGRDRGGARLPRRPGLGLRHQPQDLCPRAGAALLRLAARPGGAPVPTRGRPLPGPARPRRHEDRRAAAGARGPPRPPHGRQPRRVRRAHPPLRPVGRSAAVARRPPARGPVGGRRTPVVALLPHLHPPARDPGTFLKYATVWSWRLDQRRGRSPQLPEFDDDPSTWAWPGGDQG
jgi:hypothetical protein